MPRRKLILANSEIYHVYNRSLRKMPIFKRKRDAKAFLLRAKFYLQADPPVKFSVYNKQKNKYDLDKNDRLVKVLTYCLMPNHFHFILKQIKTDGIKNFVSKTSNSFAHFFNTKYENRGHLFESHFKAARISSETQLLHLSRYIHLNPVTSFLTEDPKDYLYSSYNIYLQNRKSDVVEPSLILSHFQSAQSYAEFCLDQKDYQRELKYIESLILEKTNSPFRRKRTDPGSD